MRLYPEPHVLLGYLAHAHAKGTRPFFPLLRGLGTRLNLPIIALVDVAIYPLVILTLDENCIAGK